ncbi:hypothetical protein AVEN_252481-1 [Araneus ventricosus]|uniref:Uncharacterized protein n=1 Tax=Araneus ventricosus TaxID=182803 RepID=A0A4Y2AT63_ARAVE|nr:hypothetical protein AVEN_252481-1 [Araneus ventricosus]
MPGDEVIGDSFQTFLFEVWRWLPHMPRHCEGTLRGIVKCHARSTTTALIAVREAKSSEVGREKAMFREDNTISSPVSESLHYATKLNTKHTILWKYTRKSREEHSRRFRFL